MSISGKRDMTYRAWRTPRICLYGFLEDHREEIIEAADKIPDVMRELLDLLDFRIASCADCGCTLNDADVRHDNGFCIDCYSQQPD